MRSHEALRVGYCHKSMMRTASHPTRPLGRLLWAGVRQSCRHHIEKPPGGSRCYHRVAGVDLADRLQKLIRRSIFEQEAAGACLQGTENVFVVVESRQDQDGLSRKPGGGSTECGTVSTPSAAPWILTLAPPA